MKLTNDLNSERESRNSINNNHVCDTQKNSDDNAHQRDPSIINSQHFFVFVFAFSFSLDIAVEYHDDD